jgi:hypothetical protein
MRRLLRSSESTPRLAAFVASLALLALSACATTTVFGAGAVEASGPTARRQLFTVVGFDEERWRAPRLVAPVFCVRLAAGEPAVRTDVLTLAQVERALPRWTPPPGVGEEFVRSFPAHDVRTHDVFMGRGYWVSFREGRLVALSVSDAESAAAAQPVPATPEAGSVGPKSCDRLYPLPIDREQFVEIFGAPDREAELTDY